MTEGSARDDAADAVAPRAPGPGTAGPAAAGSHTAPPDDLPGDGGPADETPVDDARADDTRADDTHRDRAPSDGALSDGVHADGRNSHEAGRDDADHEEAEHDDRQAHDQPTRPAYGHLYGVERSLDSFLPLQDVVFAVDEPFLEALRDFAAHALADMRRLGAGYDHLHFRDVAPVWHESWPDIVLVAPRPPADPAAQQDPQPGPDGAAQGGPATPDR